MTAGRPWPSFVDRHPLVARYLTELEAELVRSGTPQEEIVEILADIEGYFVDAQSSGRSLSSTLKGLGAVRELAGAYAVALALGVSLEVDRTAATRAPRRGWLDPARALIRLTALALLAVMIGGLGAALLTTGVLGVVAALVLPFVPSSFLDPTLRAGLPQLVVLAVGTLSVAVGWLSLRTLRLHWRSLLLEFRRRHRPRTVGRAAAGRTDHRRRSPGASASTATVSRPAIETWRRS